MPNSSAGERLATLIAPIVGSTGLDLEDVEVLSAGRRRLVRILVDKDDGVTLDDVSTLSQQVSAVLDGADADRLLGASAYVLEVSSPGVDRPLVAPRHWRRARGRLVATTPAGRAPFTARVADADDVGVRFVTDGGDELTLRYDELGPGRVQVEFNRPGAVGDADDASADDAAAEDVE